METEKTDKTMLSKGLKILGLSLISMFIGPTAVFLSFSNKDKSFYIPLLIIAILVCCLAVFFAFKGLNTVVNSMFKKK
ncbi:MAG: DUF6095 family protein [Aestuariibaculum sp.]